MTLRSAIATPAGKRRYVRRLFATIADRYDFITIALSYGQDRRWKRRLLAVAGITPDDRVLDLACGTGDLVFGAATRAGTAVGLDITHRMLQLAHRRVAKARPASADANRRAVETRAAPAGVGRSFTGSHVTLVEGDMQALPFGDARFTVVTTGYGLRNVPDLPVAIREIHRVLIVGGRLCSLDFNRPRPPVVRAVYLAYLTVVGSTLGLILHGDPDTYRYIPESIRQYPGAAGVARLMEQHGFIDVRVLPVLGGLMAIHTARKA